MICSRVNKWVLNGDLLYAILHFFKKYLKFNPLNNSKENFKSLPNNKILYWTKFKAFADDKVNLNEKIKLVWGRVENIMGKEENAAYQHFSFSNNVCKSFLFQGH